MADDKPGDRHLWTNDVMFSSPTHTSCCMLDPTAFGIFATPHTDPHITHTNPSYPYLSFMMGSVTGFKPPWVRRRNSKFSDVRTGSPPDFITCFENSKTDTVNTKIHPYHFNACPHESWSVFWSIHMFHGRLFDPVAVSIINLQAIWCGYISGWVKFYAVKYFVWTLALSTLIKWYLSCWSCIIPTKQGQWIACWYLGSPGRPHAD